jgi:FkbM family methyltransferase
MIHESEIELYKILLPQLKVVFDVGCADDNIFYELNPEIEVHLFDPEYREHLDNNKDIHYNDYALGNKKGFVDYYYRYGSILLRDDEPKFDGWHEKREIRIDTLLNYCKANKIKSIDLLKIDAEGYDIEVVKGCGKMLGKIKYIQFEVWDSTITELIELFNGYNIYRVGGKPLNLMATKETLPLRRYEHLAI